MFFCHYQCCETGRYLNSLGTRLVELTFDCPSLITVSVPYIEDREKKQQAQGLNGINGIFELDQTHNQQANFLCTIFPRRPLIASKAGFCTNWNRPSSMPWCTAPTASSSGSERDAIEATLSGLDCGCIRVAERQGVGEWTVNQWVKKAVLLSFRLSDGQLLRSGDLSFSTRSRPSSLTRTKTTPALAAFALRLRRLLGGEAFWLKTSS